MKTLLTLRSIVIGTALLTASVATFATETTWDFTGSLASSENNDSKWGSGRTYGNELSFNGGALKVNAWADTNEISGDDTIEVAAAARNSSGLLNYNQNYNQGNDEHFVDNRSDTDMLLFTFDELVTITDINIGYYENDTDISIAAFNSVPTLNEQTWAQVAGDAFYTASFSNIGGGVSSLSSPTAHQGVVNEAKYWLIGAYNSSFGHVNSSLDDFIKIAGITTKTTPTTDNVVAEPGTLAFFASFGAFMMWRRRKNT